MKRVYPDHPVIGIGAVIISEGKLLLEKRKNEPGKGKWSIPGGVVELGEGTAQTVVREVKEETGLDVKNCRLIDVADSVRFDKNGSVKYHFVIIDYLVTVKKGVPKAASDAEDLKWVTLGEVENFDLTESFRLFFQKNKRKMGNVSWHL